MQVGDLVRGWDGPIGVVTHVTKELHQHGIEPFVFVTVLWDDIGPHLEKSCDLEVINEASSAQCNVPVRVVQ